jgi:hypothetical protein
MHIISDILKDLEIKPQENENEYVSELEIYEFIIKNCGYDKIADSLEFFYIRLTASAISSELINQDQHGIPSFDEDYIIELLNDKGEHEYHSLFEYYFGRQKYLEYHTINKKTYFFGENLKLEYNLLIKAFSMFITADLNLALEKLKRHLTEKVKLESWCDLILGGHDNDYTSLEKERIAVIVSDVLK